MDIPVPPYANDESCFGDSHDDPDFCVDDDNDSETSDESDSSNSDPQPKNFASKRTIGGQSTMQKVQWTEVRSMQCIELQFVKYNS